MAYNAEYMKSYYLKHREAYLQKSKDRCVVKNPCPCGGRYSLSYKSHHVKTMRHKKWMESLNTSSTGEQQSSIDQ